MYKRVPLSFFNVAAKLYSNVFTYSVHQTFITSQFKYVTKIHALVTRGCSTTKYPKIIVEYDKLYKQQLDELLKDPQYKAAYEKCKLEIEFLKCTSKKVPSTITDYDWLHLLKSSSKGQRRAYLAFRWKVKMKEKNREKKKELKQLNNNSVEKNDDSTYGLSKCTMFFRIRESTINQFYNSRLINAILHEPTVVFDCGYETTMAPYELHNCAKQLLLSFSENRIHNDPFNLYFCNANINGPLIQRLHRTIPQLLDLDFPLNVTEKSYLDIFDRKKLVYLTPHCNTVMTEYDPNLIYIIGALVDKTNPKAFSLHKAKREGIKMMKFPLSEVLEWGMGSTKSLPLNQVLSILLDLRYTNDWKRALKHIPVRKLKDKRESLLLRKLEEREKKIQLMLNVEE